jgi:hypothetical protein
MKIFTLFTTLQFFEILNHLKLDLFAVVIANLLFNIQGVMEGTFYIFSDGAYSTFLHFLTKNKYTFANKLLNN